MSRTVTVIFLDQSFEKFCMFLKSVPWYFFHNSANFFHFLYMCYFCFIFLLEFLMYVLFTQTFFVILYPDVNSRGAVKLKEVFWVHRVVKAHWLNSVTWVQCLTLIGYLLKDRRLLLFCSYCKISAFEEPIKHAPLLMLDGNITQEAIDHACSFCAANHIPGKKEIKRKVKIISSQHRTSSR